MKQVATFRCKGKGTFVTRKRRVHETDNMRHTWSDNWQKDNNNNDNDDDADNDENDGGNIQNSKKN
jgi:hypothetical protein